LAPETTDDAFSGEVEDRLEDLFGDQEPAEDVKKDAEQVKGHPLRELKTTVLSIDWEITDEVMTKFVEQIAALQNTYQKDKIILVFLQLLGSIGEYIRINLGKSHPDAFKILNSLFENLEKTVLSEDMPEADRKKILAGELNKYKKLKSQLAISKPRSAERPQAESTQKPAPEAPQEIELAAALEQLKALIQTEFDSIRADLKLLREELSKVK
jgi:hypothetical protein